MQNASQRQPCTYPLFIPVPWLPWFPTHFPRIRRKFPCGGKRRGYEPQPGVLGLHLCQGYVHASHRWLPGGLSSSRWLPLRGCFFGFMSPLIPYWAPASGFKDLRPYELHTPVFCRSAYATLWKRVSFFLVPPFKAQCDDTLTVNN